MATSRRRQGVRKKTEALGSFISGEARQLARLAGLLNERWRGAAHAELREQVIAVIEATLPRPHPHVTRRAGKLFARLAAGQNYTFQVHPLQSDDVVVLLDWSTEPGLAALELWRWFRNPARDRLRRCQQCGTWFDDLTRNKSALRCSRACTIAWSNAQRAKKESR